MSKQEYYVIKSIVKAFEMIEALASEKDFSLADLNAKLKFQKTSTHRMLLTLKSLGYVDQNAETQRYQASMKFFQLGCQVVSHLDYIEVAHPFMMDLAAKTGENVNLGLLDGMTIIHVDRVASKHTLKLDMPVGSSERAYCTSLGKAILAFMPKEDRQKLYETESLEKCTSHSLVSWDELEEDLVVARETGYALDQQEAIEGICCVGAPIFSPNKDFYAAISISGPSLRMTSEKVPELGSMVAETARQITDALGGRPA